MTRVEKVKSAPVIEWKTKTVINTVKVTVTAPAVAPVAPSDPGYLNPVTLANSIASDLQHAPQTVECVP